MLLKNFLKISLRKSSYCYFFIPDHIFSQDIVNMFKLQYHMSTTANKNETTFYFHFTIVKTAGVNQWLKQFFDF